MIQQPYSSVALIYNKLMRSVNYNQWAEYIYSIYEMMNIKGDKILELAAGNLEVADRLATKFNNIIVSDFSSNMLKLKDNSQFAKVCCNMINLPFCKQFDFIYSTFDSINYLFNEDLLTKFFQNIFYKLSENSCLTFDVSLEKNSIKHEKRLNRRGKVGKIKYIQKSSFDPVSKMHINHFKIKLESGEIVEEIHKQKIYDFYYYFEVIENCNMYVTYCFDAFSFENATPDSERAQFVVKRKN